MKPPTLSALVLLQFVLTANCYSQLIAEAGIDTAVCEADSPTLSIGGNPTASGGIAPYTYTWSGSYEYAGRTYTASFMLDDTTLANPTFKEGCIPDSVFLFVTVKGADNNTSRDSIQIRLSRYTAYLGECRFDIHEGDSVQLGHLIFGGIPPLLFQWEPAGTLTDGSVENPWAFPSVSTSYVLHITDSIGCVTESNCKVFVTPSGIEDRTDNQELELIPDRSEKILHVKISGDFEPGSTFELINLTGTTLIMMTVEAEMISIDVQQLDQGLYIYRWTSGKKRIVSGKILL